MTLIHFTYPEVQALSDLAEFLEKSRGDGGPDDVLLRGLERVAREWRMDGAR